MAYARERSVTGSTPVKSSIRWTNAVADNPLDEGPLSRHALQCLRDVKNKPAPASAATCGAIRGLLRRGYIEPAMLPSPIPADNGKLVKRLQITMAGLRALEGRGP